MLTLICGKLYYDSASYNITFSQISPFRNKLSRELVNNFFSKDRDLRSTSEGLIKELALRDLGYENWIDYKEYINLSLYLMDVMENGQEDLVVALTLSKDVGVIGVYRLVDKEYILTNKVEDLTSITKVYSIKDRVRDKSLLIVEQLLDEMVGAYFTDSYIQIFAYMDNEFIEVFKHSLDYTSYYYDKWNNPNMENPKWYKLMEKGIISEISTGDDGIIFNITKTISKYVADETPDNLIPDEFTLDKEDYMTITYAWSNKYNSFIQGEATLKRDGETVGILAASSQTAYHLLNKSDKYYKVIGKNGKIVFIKEAEIENLTIYSH